MAIKYHPDANPEDSRSHHKFIQINQAYHVLIGIAKPAGSKLDEARSASAASADTAPQTQVIPISKIKATATGHGIAVSCCLKFVALFFEFSISSRKLKSQQNPQLTDAEQLLKQKEYLQLQGFLQDKRFARAVVLLEALIQRLPQYPDVKEWLARAYQRWGSPLITQKKLDQARRYLKKALRTDPHNRSLWLEVERDFCRIEQMSRSRSP